MAVTCFVQVRRYFAGHVHMSALRAFILRQSGNVDVLVCKGLLNRNVAAHVSTPFVLFVSRALGFPACMETQ